MAEKNGRERSTFGTGVGNVVKSPPVELFDYVVMDIERPLSLQSGLPHHFPLTLHLPPGRLATENFLPSMIRGMAFFHRDKYSATRCANFSTRGEGPFNGRAVVR
jgi:hypothetical protein